MPPLATSDEQPDQISQNSEIRRNDYGYLDQGGAAITPEEPQVKESTASYGSTVSPGSRRCAMPRHVVQARSRPTITSLKN